MSATATHARKRTAASASKPTTRRENILLAAEMLFGNRGFDAVTLRDIALEAGVPIGLISYHFAGREGLLHSIFEHRRHYIEERRATLRALGDLVQGEESLPLIVRAFVEPVMRLRAQPDSGYFMRLVARGLSDQTDPMASIVEEFFDPMAREFIAAFGRALPGRSAAQVAWAYDFALGALLVAMADTRRIERLSDGRCRPGDAQTITPLLVDFIVGGLRNIAPRAEGRKLERGRS